MVSPLFSYCTRHALTATELSIAPHLNQQLVPQHIRASLASRGLDFESPNFKPLTKDQMMARLD
jgi:glycogen synthase kinase 3 beta